MLDKDIDKARDSIRANLDLITDRLEHKEYELNEIKEAMDDIYDICNGADEENWRDCIERIQNVALLLDGIASRL